MPLPFDTPVLPGSVPLEEAILGLPTADPTAGLFPPAVPVPPELPVGPQLPQLPPTPDSPNMLMPPVGAPPGAPPGGQGQPQMGKVDQILQMLLRAAPGFAFGAAGGRGGIGAAGSVATGVSTALNQRAVQLARERALALDERQTGLQEQHYQQQQAAQEQQRVEGEKQRRVQAVSGILDRARDDAGKFEGSPEAFAEWKDQVRQQLAQYDAAQLADTLRFPNERYLKAAAAEDKDWWDLVVKQHYDKLTSGKPEDLAAVMQMTRYSAVRGRSITLKDAAASIGLADEEGNIRAPERSKGISGYVRVPTGTKGEFTYKPAEDVIGQTFKEDPKEYAPERPRQGPSQTFVNEKTGEVEVVMTDESGKTRRVRIPASEGFQLKGGGDSFAEEFMRSLGLLSPNGEPAPGAAETPGQRPQPSTRKPATVGERRRFPDGVRTWDGTSWKK
jgi:hypothetical protein